MLLAGANAAYIVTTYVVTTVTARMLEPVEFGQFGVVMAWVTLLTALLVKGLMTSMSREMAAGEVDAGTAWRAGCGVAVRLSVALAVAGIAAAPVVATVLGSGELARNLAVGALGALTFGVNAALLAWPTGTRAYGRQALAQVVYALSRAALVIGGAAAFGLEGAVVGYVLAPLLASASLVTRHPTSNFDLAPVRRRMARAVVPVALTSLAVAAFFVIDVFALSSVVGERSAQVGIYVAYGTVAHVPFFLLQATGAALVPTLAATRAAADRARTIRRTTTDTIVLLSGPTLLIATSGDAAARLVFGDEYHANDPIVLPLALATGAVTIVATLVAIDAAIGQMRWALGICAAGVVMLGVLGVEAAGRDSGTPASNVAWATLVVCVATAVALAIAVRLRHGALLEMSRSAQGLIAASIAAAPPLLADGDLMTLLVAVVCGVGWLAAVVQAGIIDVRRSPNVPGARDSEYPQRP